MANGFKLAFPLIFDCDDSFRISFSLQRGTTLEFTNGMYYVHGDNGSGKTTFLNMLSLIAGYIGKKAESYEGMIKFGDEEYYGNSFNHIKAAQLREKYFCIFPQKVFFLPISTRDNYDILNGTDKTKTDSFSPRESPDLLSGGQQQKILMDIILDSQKPVWFIDEPLTNLDTESRHYFWKTLYRAYQKALSIIFFIDHSMEMEISHTHQFQHYNTLRVFSENHRDKRSNRIGFKSINIYRNNAPESFLLEQINKIERKITFKKNINPLLLRESWGAMKAR
jgi:ABC-type lipoprotein export system ATPase subunit